MITKSELKAKFVKPIFSNVILILGGFLLAPSHLLLSFYQNHELFRYLAISIGSLVVIFALFSMLDISLKVMRDASSKP
jgi:hypothetical protein